MKALTLWRPWAQAIVYGTKRIENRNWMPPNWIIGQRIAIHAGQKYDKEGADWMKSEGLYIPYHDGECELGIIGTAVVTGYVCSSEDPWFMGKYGWTLDNVEALNPPVHYPGKQGLWNFWIEEEE